MLRMQAVENAKGAESYYSVSDGGYYYEPGAVRQEWVGSGAAKLGLAGPPDFEQFRRLLNGLDPHTGGQLTALLVDHRVCGLDVNVHCPKGVTTAINRGDGRLEAALWAALHETIAFMEQSATTRVRRGGKQEDRITGNLVGFAVPHEETRPAKDDGMPDWHKHIHAVIFNLTEDGVEGQWKAVKFRALMDRRRLFDRHFNQCFAKRAADLGYAVETQYKPDGRGGLKYAGWDIRGIPASVIEKTSRRSHEVEDAEQAILADMKARDPDAPDRLSEVAKDKLGATTRQRKREDVTLDALRAYWDGRLTPEESEAIAATIEAARQGRNPTPENRAAEAMAYAIAHHFERRSVVGWDDLLVTAMEKSMGAARPEDFLPEAERQGVLFEGGEVTTRAVLAQEQRIIGFARAGRGMFQPLGAGREDGLAGLSDEQQAAVRHVWRSTDRIILVRGGAGTGKTTMMAPALAHLNAPAMLLAPSADAARGQLRKEGFDDANTVAAFLGDEAMQERVRGGVIWCDEAGLLSVGDLDRLCGVAKALDARIVLQGDPKQHKAVAAHGNMLTVLEDYAGLPVAKLTAIQRQKGDYAQAVAAIRDGDLSKGDGILRNLGWIVEGQGQHDALVAEYARAIEETKAGGGRKSVLVVDPTNKDGDALTERLRAVLKDKGLVGKEETAFKRLVPLNWTDAEKSDAGRYGGAEIVQFFRKCGAFRAGDRLRASELLPHLPKLKPSSFAVYGEAELKLAEGDTIRITANGRDATGKHRLDNGRVDQVRGFTPGGDIVLANGWVMGKDFAHLKHGLVSTSHASQSKTVDVVLAAMNRASLGAMSAEQGYVTISRGRERGMIFTDMSGDELLDAIARADRRRSATELLQPKPGEAIQPEADASGRVAGREASGMGRFMERVRATYRQLQRRAEAALERWRDRELGYAR